MMKSLIVNILIFLASSIYAGDALLLTDLGSSARMIALGNVEGFSHSSSAIFENPASLYPISQYSLSAFATQLMQEVSYRNIAFGTSTGLGNVAVGFMSADVSDIYRTTKPADRIIAGDTFRFENYMVKLAYQKSIWEDLSLGTALNYYSNTLGDVKGTGVNMDVGAFVTPGPFQVSLVARNVLRNLKANYSNGGSETYPLQTILAGGYNWGDLDILAQIKKTSSQPESIKAAGIHYHPGFVPFIHFYGGVKDYLANETIKTTVSLGVGLNVFGLAFDYGYEKSDHVAFDNNSYVSVSLTQ